MINNSKRDELFDLYLQGRLEAGEKQHLESLLASDPNLRAEFHEHRELVSQMKAFGERQDFLKKLKSRRSDDHQVPSPPKIVRLWKKLGINVVSAAAIAIISAFATLFFTGYFQNMERNSSNYRELRRDMNAVKRNVNAQNAVINNISDKQPSTPNNFGATGFMISHLGYIVTNHHVIAGADSVHIQNAKGDAYHAKVLYADPASDLAILMISDDRYEPLKPTPYTFKASLTDLGEDVFTLGFPRDESVFGQGYLSSTSGYGGDTTSYQVSIPVNPGNSGGPLLDSKGNIIGIISGKQTGLDGVSFAIKTEKLLETLSQIPTDSIPDGVILSKRNSLSRLPRTEQVKRIQDYVFHIKVY